MRTTVEFRVVERYAPLLFRDNEGVTLGDSIRKVEIDINDPRYPRIGELQREIDSKEGRSFFHGWRIRHHYSNAEYKSAKLFHLEIKSTFEPAGEECGTKYDESAACDHVFDPELEMDVSGHRTTIPASTCGVGARQVSDLFLDWKRIPKTRDIARTIAGEVVVSRRVVELFHRHGIQGTELRPVRHRPASSAESNDWFQLCVQSGEVEITGPTKAGINPFDEDPRGRYRCPLAHVIGLNLLSDVWLSRESYSGCDMVASKQFIGCRRGLLRAERLLFISPKLRELLMHEKMKGFQIEVAHFK